MSAPIHPDKSGREKQVALAAMDPNSGSSLLPMLVSGLVMIVIGMLAAAAFS